MAYAAETVDYKSPLAAAAAAAAAIHVCVRALTHQPQLLLLAAGHAVGIVRLRAAPHSSAPQWQPHLQAATWQNQVEHNLTYKRAQVMK